MHEMRLDLESLQPASARIRPRMRLVNTPSAAPSSAIDSARVHSTWFSIAWHSHGEEGASVPTVRGEAINCCR